MSLVEKRKDFVTLLEAGDAGANVFDCACSIGSRDDVVALGKGVEALRDYEIAVIEGSGVDWRVL